MIPSNDNGVRYSGITRWGWDQRWEQRVAGRDPSLVPARVVQQRHHSYEVVMPPDARLVAAHVTGAYTFRVAGSADFPTVGDWVLVDPLSRRIQRLVERRSALRRSAAGDETAEQVIVANIDIVLLVFGLDGGRNCTVGLLERSLTTAWSSGARPVVVLNKLDRASPERLETIRATTRQAALGVPIYEVSALHGCGIDQLAREFAPGQTVAMLGKSGVGKSALLNAIGRHYGTAPNVRVGKQREGDLQGRHTTTHKELVLLPGGPIVADVPGLRELQLWGDTDDVEASFSDIEALAAECKFRDCSHGNEPGCRVRAALATGELSNRRYAHYLELRAELAYVARRKDARLIAEERKLWRQITKDARRRRRG